jgi:hypothetical protein
MVCQQHAGVGHTLTMWQTSVDTETGAVPYWLRLRMTPDASWPFGVRGQLLGAIQMLG